LAEEQELKSYYQHRYRRATTDLCDEQLVVDDVAEHLGCLGKELLGLSTDGLVIKDLGVSTVGVLAAQLPHLEEWLPVDVADQAVQVDIVEDLGANDDWGDWGILTSEGQHQSLLARLWQSQVLTVSKRLQVILTNLVILINKKIERGQKENRMRNRQSKYENKNDNRRADACAINLETM
jgi:hypothetical protein